MSEPLDLEQACEVMHDAYEKAAKGAGWETQERSRVPWADVPEANKATMRAAVRALVEWLPIDRLRDEQIAAVRDDFDYAYDKWVHGAPAAMHELAARLLGDDA